MQYKYLTAQKGRAQASRIYQRDGIAVLEIVQRNGERHEFVFDADDIEKVARVRSAWCILRSAKIPYAATMMKSAEHPQTRRCLLLHRLLMDDPIGMCVDHLNRNTYDNRKQNLRIVTKAENTQNSAHSRGLTGIRNVSFNKPLGKFVVYVTANRRTHFIGAFRTADEAANAAREARERIQSHCPENTVSGGDQ